MHPVLRTLIHALFPIALVAQPHGSAAIFRFEAGEFWLNPHHFLCILGRAEAKTPDSSLEAVANAPGDASRGLSGLSEESRVAWREAVTTYAKGLSLKDAVFDDPLPEIARILADTYDAPSLASRQIDLEVAPTPERAGPIYRKVWLPAHLAANRSWQASVQEQVNRHGSVILEFITKAYGMRWPAAGYPVHLSAYSNLAGAYSTRGNLLVVGSLGPSRANENLETVFHKGTHQWDDEISSLLREHMRKADRTFPRGLAHAMIFFTAGEAVRQVIPGYTPFADASGIWKRGMQPFQAALQKVWKPYLDGKGTRDEALSAFVAATATGLRR